MWWISINGASCAFCPVPSDAAPAVSPLPQAVVGFPTEEAARAAQHSCLNDPLHVVSEKARCWRNGEVGAVVVMFPNPEPISEGQPTAWVLG